MSPALYLHKLRENTLPDRYVSTDGEKSAQRICYSSSAGQTRRFMSGLRLKIKRLFQECWNLTSSVRKLFFAVAILSFVAMTTGLTVQLHILSHRRSHSNVHNIDHCSVCQQLIALGKFCSGPHLSIDNIERFEFAVESCPNTLFLSSQPKTFDSRPPPSVS